MNKGLDLRSLHGREEGAGTVATDTNLKPAEVAAVKAADRIEWDLCP